MQQIDIKINGEFGAHELTVDYQIIEAETDVGYHGGAEIQGVAVIYGGRERKMKKWSGELDEYLCNHIDENE